MIPGTFEGTDRRFTRIVLSILSELCRFTVPASAGTCGDSELARGSRCADNIHTLEKRLAG